MTKRTGVKAKQKECTDSLSLKSSQFFCQYGKKTKKKEHKTHKGDFQQAFTRYVNILSIVSPICMHSTIIILQFNYVYSEYFSSAHY